jgi:transglutaminase-like putative cysteine protease
MALLLLVALSAHAALVQDLALLDRLKSAPTTEDYPDDDAVWLLRDTEITVAPDGTYRTREHVLAKILTTQGLALTQWEIPYDAACEAVQVTMARTLVNGQAFPVDPTQVVENAVYPQAAWYDSVLVRRFPLPSANIDAALDVETVRTRNTARIPGAFSARYDLQFRYPATEERFTVRVPVDRQLALRFTGIVAPKVTERVEKTQRVYRWALRAVPALRMEEAQTPPAEDLTPSVRMTTLTSWEPVVSWYQQLTEGKDAVTERLRQVALQRTAGCADVEAKLTALHKAVREVPYVATEMGAHADTPHSADEVAGVNYGDCKDKATLLRALLKAVGIASDYVLLRTTTRGALDRTLYGPDEFNHVILVVSTPHGDRFVDPTLPDAPWTCLPPGVDGAGALLIRGPGELVTLPPAAAQENLTDIRVTVTVGADGSATGRATLTLHGQSAMLQRGMLAPIATDRFREALEDFLAPRLGAEVAVKAVTVAALREPERPLLITADFSSPGYLQDAGEQWSGYLPTFAYQPNRFRAITTRLFPFAQPIESALHLEVIVRLPADFQVTHLPTPVQYTSAIGQYQDDVRVAGQSLYYTCDLATRRGTFPPESLAEVSRWADILALAGRNQLQFFLRRR